MHISYLTILEANRGPTTNRLSTEAVVADSHQGEPGDRPSAPVPTAATGRGAPKAISVVDLEAEEELPPTEEKSPDTEEITQIRKIKSKVDNWMSEHNVSPGVGCPSESSQDSVQTCGDSSVPSSAGACNRREALAKAVVRSQATPLQATPAPVTPKKKTETAKFVEDYFRDLRAKEAEEKKQEQERLNAGMVTNAILFRFL